MNAKIDIVRKWYNRLKFPHKYDEAFGSLLDSTDVVIRDNFSDNAAENFLSALYQCETLEKRYISWGIDLKILEDTLSDVKIWTNTWYELTGELGLKETEWLSNHYSGRLFRLGRLQFGMGHARQDIVQKNVEKGAPVIDIHIPAGEPMDNEACKEAIRMAQKFFGEYFPEFKYQCFTCHSWLLDRTLEQFLDKGSNILAFQGLFDVVGTEESDALLKYIFAWDATRERLDKYEPKSGLAKKVKSYAQSGCKFYVPYGVIDESKL